MRYFPIKKPYSLLKPKRIAVMKYPLSVKILDQTRITPSPPVAGEPRPPIPLTFFDILWINYNPVERLFFYPFPHPSSHFLHSHLPKFKSALSLALSTFYPLAATLRRRSDGRFEIYPADTDSVPLTVSEYAGDASDFLDLSGDHARPIGKLLPLVPRLPKSADAQPLLAIQVTLFPDHGLCLALTVNHCACDGFSTMQFIKLWATATSRSEMFSTQALTPCLDRSVIPDPRNLYAQMESSVLAETAEEKKVVVRTTSEVYGAIFTLTATEIGQIKKNVQRKAAEQGMSGFHCTSFVVSCAYSWICLLKTRYIADEDGFAHFVFAADWRRRIRPPIPPNFFGNCLTGCFVKCKVEALFGDDGIFAACSAIGKGIEELGDDVHENMDGIIDRLAAVAPYRPLSLAGSPKLGVYDIDFGWGKPSKVEVTSTRETGAMALAESRDGDGGIEFGVILPEEDLKLFAHHFAAGRN